MKTLVVLISNAGAGTNLQAIIDATNNNSLFAKIDLVVSSDVDAYGLIRAEKSNIPTRICSNKKDLLSILNEYSPDYICLAGWRQIITDDVLNSYSNKILNLHPGLIPDKFDGDVSNPDGTIGLWNRGKLTDVAIQNFLDNNVTYAGSSIHFLSNKFDFGIVLDRCFEKVRKGDTSESLYKRLKEKENKMYTRVLIELCNEE